MENNQKCQMTKESIEKIFDGMSDLLVKKNSDYKGASFDLGLNGNMVHLWDKATRYRNMVEKMKKAELINELGCSASDFMSETEMSPLFESVEDTLRDMIGYAVIGIHILNSRK